jgi:hypothetical protein
MKRIYEPHHVPPIPVERFVLRLLTHLAVALGLIAFSLAVGMLGFRCLEGMRWIDAFLNASMLLGGMGPVKIEGLSAAGKLFAGCYALYSGLAFIAVMGVMLVPVVHRVMHRFHWSEDGDD